MMLLLKILLGVCTLVTAVLAVSDKKSLYEPAKDDMRPWYRRLTKWGFAKIGFAIATFALGGLNEYLSASSSAEASKQQSTLQEIITNLNRQAIEQKKNLEEARDSLASVGDKLAAQSRTLDLFDKSSRDERVLYGAYQAALSPMSGLSHEFVNRKGEKYLPAREDRIEYNLVCRAGPIPIVPPSCYTRSFGALIANGDRISIATSSGVYVYQGSASTGGAMTYEAPLAECLPLREQLQNALCEVNLDVSRKRSTVQLQQMRKEGFPFNSGLTDAAHDDLCRAYEILYGRSCTEDMPKR